MPDSLPMLLPRSGVCEPDGGNRGPSGAALLRASVAGRSASLCPRITIPAAEARMRRRLWAISPFGRRIIGGRGLGSCRRPTSDAQTAVDYGCRLRLRHAARAFRHILSIQRAEYSSGVLSQGTSSLMRANPSASIQRPRTGKIDKNPPAISSTAASSRGHRLDGCRSHSIADLARWGSLVRRCVTRASHAAAVLALTRRRPVRSGTAYVQSRRL